MKGKDGIARAIYVTASGERMVVVHAFTKKTQKTPAKLRLNKQSTRQLVLDDAALAKVNGGAPTLATSELSCAYTCRH